MKSLRHFAVGSGMTKCGKEPKRRPSDALQIRPEAVTCKKCIKLGLTR